VLYDACLLPVLLLPENYGPPLRILPTKVFFLLSPGSPRRFSIRTFANFVLYFINRPILEFPLVTFGSGPPLQPTNRLTHLHLLIFNRVFSLGFGLFLFHSAFAKRLFYGPPMPLLFWNPCVRPFFSLHFVFRSHDFLNLTSIFSSPLETLYAIWIISSPQSFFLFWTV